MKLIPMTDFALEQEKKFNQWEKTFDSSNSFWKCIKYANFLKQPLKLEMFVPCDKYSNFLEEPLQEHYTDCTEEQNAKDWLYNLEKYQQAKEKVLFETNYELHIIKDILTSAKIIEDLVTCSKLNITLTPNAIKQLGL